MILLHDLITALARLLIFPGLLFAVPAAWFFLWVERKAVALMQERVGPPFMQPFWDFMKLLGKSTPPRPGIAGFIMRAWPLIAVSSAAGAVGLLPVLPLSGGFEGDLILLLAKSARRAKPHSASPTTSFFCWPSSPSPPRSTRSGSKHWPRCTRPSLLCSASSRF